MEEHYRKLERMYLSAPINHFYSPGIEISRGSARIETAVKEEFFHAAQAIHGSIYFKILDDAAFFAVNSLVKEFFVLTVSFNVHLLRPVDRGLLVGLGKVVQRSRHHYVGESQLFLGKEEVAQGTGTFLKSGIKLTDSVGYE